MAQFVVCQPIAGGPSVAPCADVGGSATAPVVMELAVPGSVNLTYANEQFAFGLMFPLLFWALGHCVGAILSTIRQAG